MKKLLVVLLALTMVFAFAACGEQGDTEANTQGVVDLGGGLGEYTFIGNAFGTYEVIETPDEFVFSGESEITVYADAECDIPYIAVYRFAKGEDTLETVAQAEADLYAEGFYQMYESFDNFPAGAYLCSYAEYDGNFYYVDSMYVEDGDDFVVVDCYSKTEELQIGDTDVYAWVPVGYTDMKTEDDIDHGTIFWGEYSDDYYLPTIWLGKWDDSYAYLQWLWSEEYPDGLPISEKEYADMLASWDEDSAVDYYEKLGAEVVFSSTAENESYPYDGEYTVLTGIANAMDIWFQIGDDYYSAWFAHEFDPAPAYAGVFLNSLHTK